MKEEGKTFFKEKYSHKTNFKRVALSKQAHLEVLQFFVMPNTLINLIWTFQIQKNLVSVFDGWFHVSNVLNLIKIELVVCVLVRRIFPAENVC